GHLPGFCLSCAFLCSSGGAAIKPALFVTVNFTHTRARGQDGLGIHCPFGRQQEDKEQSMHISNERYIRERQRHDLALRMIRHEARTCTIRSCTGLTEDRIRKLYKAFAEQLMTVPLRRKRGKSPRQIAYFTRTTQL